jgi:hypothetical protein
LRMGGHANHKGSGRVWGAVSGRSPEVQGFLPGKPPQSRPLAEGRSLGVDRWRVPTGLPGTLDHSSRSALPRVTHSTWM